MKTSKNEEMAHGGKKAGGKYVTVKLVNGK